MPKVDLKPFVGCLRKRAFRSETTRGRKNVGQYDHDLNFEEAVDPYEIDTKKIEDSKAFRRLKDKAQVFSFPENPHVRTRLTHSTEVKNGAKIIARILGLNVALTEAIALGHDIGHSPYGHFGEDFIRALSGREFRHNVFGVVVAQHLERRCEGLNLCRETLEGILWHSRGGESLEVDASLPLEYGVVMIADKIEYTFADINDAVRYGFLSKEELPPELWELGSIQREREYACIAALIQESAQSGTISFSRSETAEKFHLVRRWMYRNHYRKTRWRVQKALLEETYEFLSSDPIFEGCDPLILLALLTDREVNRLADVFLSTRKPSAETARNLGIMEIIPHLRGKTIDFTDPNLRG